MFECFAGQHLLAQANLPQQFRLWKAVAFAAIALIVGLAALGRRLVERRKAKRENEIAEQTLPIIETFERGDYKRALKQFEALLRKAPKSVQVRLWKAVTLVRLDRRDEALELFNEALAKEQPGWGLALRSDLLSARGDLEGALRDINQAIQGGHRTADMFTRRAAIHEKSGEFDKALKDCTKAIEVNPDLESAYLRRGNLYRQAGNLKAAITDFNKAIELDPSPWVALNSRGICWFEARSYAKAVADYTAALKLDKSQSSIFANRGYALTILGRLKEALRDFEEALRIDPRSVDVLLSRCRTWREAGDMKRSDADLNAAYKLEPSNPDVLGTIGYRFIERGEVEKGFQFLARSAELAPNDQARLNGLAWSRATHPSPAARAPQQAIAAATRACELTKWSNAAYIDSLAAALADAGRFDDAVKMQQKAVELIDAASRAEYEQRAALYRAGKPFREDFVIKFAHARVQPS